MEGDRTDARVELEDDISIHSLRMEGDGIHFNTKQLHAISIHSLRMEGDDVAAEYHLNDAHFNPLPPHGGRPSVAVRIFQYIDISIHSLRMEGDRYRRLLKLL